MRAGSKIKEDTAVVLITLILLFLGIFLLSVDYYLAYQGAYIFILFWISLSIALFSVIAFLLYYKCEGKIRGIAIYLFLFGLVLYLTYYLQSPGHLHFQDEMNHYQATSIIMDNGNINGTYTITPLGQWYPGLAILNAISSSITKLSIIDAGRIMISLTHSFMLIFIFLFFYNISKNIMLSGLGSLVYLCNPEYINVDAITSYESLAIGLFYLLILIISLKEQRNNVAISIITIIVLLSLVITHHVTSFMLILYLCVLVLTILYLRLKIDKYLYILFMSATFVLGWLVDMASRAVLYLNGIFTNRIKTFLQVIGHLEPTRTLFAKTLLPRYEIIIDSRFYPATILLLFIIGIYIFFRSSKNRKCSFYTLFLWALIYFATWPFILTNGADAAYRSWATLFFGVAYWMAVAILALYQKPELIYKFLVGLLVAVLFIGGTSIGSNEEIRYPLTYLASDMGAITLDEIRACDWYSASCGINRKILGDRTVGYVFGCYGRQSVDLGAALKVFYPKYIDSQVSSEIRSHDALVVDDRISKLLARSGSYFADKNQKYENYPLYGLEIPLPKSSLNKFMNAVDLNQLYDNGNIQIIVKNTNF